MKTYNDIQTLSVGFPSKSPEEVLYRHIEREGRSALNAVDATYAGL